MSIAPHTDICTLKWFWWIWNAHHSYVKIKEEKPKPFMLVTYGLYFISQAYVLLPLPYILNEWNSFVPESKQSLHMLSELGDIAVTSFYYIHLEINNDHRNLISFHWYDLFTKRTIFERNRIFFPANAKALPRYNNQSDFEASSGTNQISEK